MTTTYAYLEILRRSWKLVVLATVVCAAAAFGFVLTLQPEYTATARLFVSVKASGSATDLFQGSSFAQQRVKSYADVANSQSVLGPVVQELNIVGGVNALASKIAATVPVDTVLVDISARSPSAVMASRIANAVATSFTRVVPSLELSAPGESSLVRVTPVGSAQIPPSPTYPNKKIAVLLGAMAGFIVAWLSAVARHTLDTRIRRPEDLSSLSILPLLGAVPRSKNLDAGMARLFPDDLEFEAFRQLRTNLQFVNLDKKVRCLLVTSALPGEGKTTIGICLARALGDTAASVVFVDADLRRGSASRTLGAITEAGLTDVLLGGSSLADCLVAPDEEGANFHFLPTGLTPPNPSELLGSSAMRRILVDLSAQFDFVIVDSPPVIPVTDAVVLSQIVDGVVVVAGLGHAKRASIEHTLAALARVDAHVLGFVVNRLAWASEPYAYH